jgi:hypothetical protein
MDKFGFTVGKVLFWDFDSACRGLQGASKTKLKNVDKKRMATAGRLIFVRISQGIQC